MIGTNIYTYIVLIFIFTFVMGGFIMMLLDKRDKNDDK